jgi:predicted nucleotidyltransferase
MASRTAPPETETLARLTRMLVEAARPKRIILFGSEARGEAAGDSDLDLLVVEESVPDRVAEMVRLNRLLRPLRLAVDLLVVSEEKFQYWRDTPGNVYYEAATEGQVLYEAP